MLEETEQLDPRVSALEEDMDDVESSEEDDDDDNKVSLNRARLCMDNVMC